MSAPVILTLLTDFGTSDGYLARLKGLLFSSLSGISAQIVDAAHHIAPFDVRAAAFALRHYYAAYPEGTVHIALAAGDFGARHRLVAVQYQQRWLVAPDNGLIPLALDNHRHDAAYVLHVGSCFDREFAEAVAALAVGTPIAQIGSPTTLMELIALQPVRTDQTLKGNIIHIDFFGNVITNLSRQHFRQMGAHGRDYTIHFGKHAPIARVSEAYDEAPQGEVLCRFNALGLLEIAVNQAHAASVLQLDIHDTVHVVFAPFD